MSRLVLLGVFGSAFSVTCLAQVPSSNDEPITGHDYIGSGSETVDPQSGFLSFTLPLSPASGRQLTVPFSLHFNVMAPFYLTNNGVGSTFRWTTPIDNKTSSAFDVNGWSYGLPVYQAQATATASPTHTATNDATNYCWSTSGYTFRASTGDLLDFNFVNQWPDNNNQIQSGVCSQTTYPTSANGDEGTRVNVGAPPAGTVGVQPPLSVIDKTGTVYQFPEGPGISTNPGVVSSGLTPFGALAQAITDSNGNQWTLNGQSVYQSRQSLGAGSYTDTAGRVAFSWSGLGNSSGDQIAVSGLAGGVTVKWTTTTVELPTNVEVADGSSCSFGGTPTLNAAVVSEVDLPNGQKYSFTYGGLYGLLTKIGYPDGGYVRYVWGASPSSVRTSQSWSNGSCTAIVDGAAVTDRYVSNDGTSEILHQSFSYPPPSYSGPDTFEQKLSSSSVATTYKLVSGSWQKTAVTTYNYPGQNSSPQITSVAYQDGAGNLLQTTTKTFLEPRIMLAQQTVLDNGQGVTALFCPDQFNRVTAKYEYDFQSAGAKPGDPSCQGIPSLSAGLTAAAIGPLFRQTQTVYHPYQNGGPIDRPDSVTVEDAASNMVSQTTYTYDQTAVNPSNAKTGLVAAPSWRGNPSTISRWLNTNNTFLTTAYTYFDTGQVNSITDPCGQTACSDISGASHTTTFSYLDNWITGGSSQQTSSYLTSKTDAAGHTQTFGYNFASGELASQADANQQATTYSYNDPLLRITDIYMPASPQNGGTRPHTSYVYVDGPGSSVRTVEPTGRTTTSSKDGFDHVTQTQVSSATDVISTDTTYDGLGNVSSVSNPYLSKSDPTYGTTLFTYDGLNRKTQQNNPDGTSQQWSYSGSTTTFFDESNHQTKRLSDSLSRLAQVTEAGGQTTLYNYDLLDNLVAATQTGNGSEIPRSRSFAYDSLSRLTNGTNPESGVVSYVYDANGNVSSKTDARSKTINYFYDTLNRLKSKTYTLADGSADLTPSSCFTYDASPSGVIPNGIGRLAAEWTQPGSCSAPSAGSIPSPALNWKVISSYDPGGRIVEEQQCAVAPCTDTVGTFDWNYDLAGNVTSSTNGAGTSGSFGIGFTFGYDSATRLASVTSSWDTDQSHPHTLFLADGTTVPSAYGPFGLTNAQIGVPSSSAGPLMSRLREYDNRGRVIHDTYSATAVSAQGGQPSGSPYAHILSISPNPVAKGVTAIVVTACDDICGSGEAQVYVNGSASVSGGTYTPGQQTPGQLPNTLTAGQYNVYVVFTRDDGMTFTSPTVSFTVTDQVLPDPQMTVTVNPDPVPQGEMGAVEINLTACGSNCGSGVGYFTIDGNFGGGFQIEGDGDVITYTSTLIPSGTHQMVVYWQGSESYAASSVSRDLVVVANQLSPGNISATIDPSTGVLNGEYGSVTIQNSCNTSCGGGQYFIDGNFSGGYVLDDSGSAVVPTYPGLTTGQHILTLSYFGDADYQQTQSDPITFNVIDNTLLVPTITIAYPSTPVPADSWSRIHLTLTPPATPAGASCQGQGSIIVDGQYSDFFYVQSDNTVIENYDQDPQLRPLGSGTHNGSLNYFGNGSCKQVSVPFSYQAQ